MVSKPRKIFLTGASAGFGLEIAKLACQAGHEVWGTARAISRLPQLDRFHPVELDLLHADRIEEIYRQADRESGGFDVLVNNAGSGIFGPLETLPVEDLKQQFQLLVLGQIQLIQAALPNFRKKPFALILNITSLAVDFPMPFMATYSAAKSALAQFTSCLRLELSHTNIRCVDLRPGDFHTSFHEATRRTDSVVNAEYEPDLGTTWKAVDHNMTHAPHPKIAAEAVLKILSQRKPAQVQATGDLFQATIAPMLSRLAPNRGVVEKGIRKFYGIRR